MAALPKTGAMAGPPGWRWLGRLGFAQADQLNHLDQLATQQDGQPRLLAFEPRSAVLTYTPRAQVADDIARQLEELHRRQIAPVPVQRGGQAMLHLPGQLVVLVALPLGQTGVRGMVCQLLQVTALVARQFGSTPEVRADRDAGLWCATGEHPAKLAAIGLCVVQQVAGHGVALNVAIDPARAAGLTLCGHANARYASLAAPAALSVAVVAQAWMQAWVANYSGEDARLRRPTCEIL